MESVLEEIRERGARAKLVVIDASRRNPYERRFRSYSHGLAPIDARDNALILTSAAAGKVVDDSKGQNSVLVSELLNNFNSRLDIKSVFDKTRNLDLPRLRRRAGADGEFHAARGSQPRRLISPRHGNLHPHVVPANAGTPSVSAFALIAAPRPIRSALERVAFLTTNPCGYGPLRSQGRR